MSSATQAKDHRDENGLSLLVWGISAFTLLLIVIAASAPRLTGDADREAGRLRVFEGLVEARVIAAAAEATGADDADALWRAAAALMKGDPSIRRVFFISEGGVDPIYGTATERQFVYDSETNRPEIGEADKALYDQAKKISASAEELGPLAIPMRELVAMGNAGGGLRRFVVAAPAMGEATKEGAPAPVLGTAGIIRETEKVAITPHFAFGVALAVLGALLFVLLLSVRREPRRMFAATAATVFILGAGGASLEVGAGERGVADLQVEVLNLGVQALQAAAPGASADAELAWKIAWRGDERSAAASSDGVYSVVEDAVSARARGRLVFPIALLAVGLALSTLAIRGTAELVFGIRSQPTTYAYIAPVLLAMVAVIFYPFLKGVEFAFLDASAEEFVGLANFKDVLMPPAGSDTNFWFTTGVTVMWTVINVVLHVTIGLFLALLLNNKKIRFKGIYRVLLIVPWAVPNYITALTWKTMFNQTYGAVNIMLASVGVEGPNWFGPDFLPNFTANLITNVWLGFPFMMVVSLGALQSIPSDLYEAADIDGAGRWQQFRRITLPLLKPALFPAIILGTIWTFNQFNVIYLVSGGGPNHKTEILITEAYFLFKTLNQYGLAAAYCIMIFLILLTYTIMTNRITKATEGAYD